MVSFSYLVALENRNFTGNFNCIRIHGNFQTKHLKNNKYMGNKVMNDDCFLCSNSKIIQEIITNKNILKKTKINKLFV
jgi:hypothetical protein